jgi:hypothetical protein
MWLLTALILILPLISVAKYQSSIIHGQYGPLAVRETDFTSAFPAGIITSSSFNQELTFKRGIALGMEFRGTDKHVALGYFIICIVLLLRSYFANIFYSTRGWPTL